MATTGGKVHAKVQTIIGVREPGERERASTGRGTEVPAAMGQRKSRGPAIRVRIDPAAWRAMHQPGRNATSKGSPLPPIGARSEIHGGSWEGPLEEIDPFGNKDRR